MREIKFRIWDNRRKHYLNTRDIIIRPNGEIAGVRGGSGTVKEWQTEQFTGLKDRNGKEIYEGDMVTISRYFPDEVLYLVTVTDIRRIPEEFYGSNFNWSHIDGNVNENPELGRIPAPQATNSVQQTHSASVVTPAPC